MSTLAKSARILGDRKRGGLIFYRIELSCIQCHTAGEGAKLLGPDLSQLGERATYEHVIESILRPSQAILEGYRTSILFTVAGQVVTGMVRKQTDEELVVVVPGEDQPRIVLMDEIDQQIPGKTSIMPAGLVNQLQGENDFFATWSVSRWSLARRARTARLVGGLTRA